MDDESMKALVKAIKRHSGMDSDQIIEAGEHGADAGWPGFTYTADAAKFFAKNAEQVWELLYESASDQGLNIPEMIGQFNRVDMAESWDGFQNLLAWFALEESGRWLEAQREG